MMVEREDTTDLDMSRSAGNRFRDALKVGELCARAAGVTTPSQAPATEKV